MQRRLVLCAYGVKVGGTRQLIDFQIVKAEGEDTWYGTSGAGGSKASGLSSSPPTAKPDWSKPWGGWRPAVAHQRCWAHKLRNLENQLKASQGDCLDEAKLIYQAPHRTEAIARFRA